MKKFCFEKIRECEGLLKGQPLQEHFTQTISEDSELWLGGKKVGVYFVLPAEVSGKLLRAAKSTKISKTFRTLGLPTASSVFGTLPRNQIRHDVCRYSAKSRDEPENFQALIWASKKLSELYSQHLPAEFEKHRKLVDEMIPQDWRPTNEAPFTTFNINVNHAIKYHRDAANLHGVYSNVLILREGCGGGELVFPEYGFALKQQHGALAIFDGQNEIHGVMPIKKISPNGFRASLVFYVMEQLKNCYPYAKELERYKVTRTAREAKKLDPEYSPYKKAFQAAKK